MTTPRPGATTFLNAGIARRTLLSQSARLAALAGVAGILAACGGTAGPASQAPAGSSQPASAAASTPPASGVKPASSSGPAPSTAAGQPKPGGTLRVAAAGNPTGLDPALDSQYLAWIAINHIYEGVYSMSKDGKLRPQLAADLPR
ncbi:MAG: hypothetical protein ACYDAG_18310, partial [Chloroflexota bacterium]